MITSSEIKECSAEYKKKCDNEEYKKLRKAEAINLRKLEKDLLNTKSFSNFTYEESQKFYDCIELEFFMNEEEPKNFLYKLQELSLAGCSKIYLSSLPGSLENNERFLEWFRHFRLLCIENNNEKELSLSLGKFKKNNFGNNGFIIKTPKISIDEKVENEKSDSLTHEAFIGLYALNSLRKKGIPNFAYMYGAYETYYPKTQSNDKTSVFCFLYEDINYKETLFDTCKNSNYENILSLYLQVIFSLKYANDYYDYAHYDLHSKNVLIRNVSTEEFDIEYEYDDGKKIWIRSPNGSVATIIDYSTSFISIKADEKVYNFGYNNYEEVPFEQVGIYTDRGFVISDSYKLLLHILICTYLANRPAFDKLKVLLSFFTNESPETCIIEQKDTFFHLPYNTKTRELKISDYISFILKKFENSSIIRYKSSGKNLKCIGNELEVNVKYFKNNLYYIPTNMIQLYDFIKYYGNLYNETKDDRYVGIINQTVNGFEKEYGSVLYKKEKERLSSFSTILNTRFMLHELSYNINILKNPAYITVIHNHIKNCIYYLNSWERMKTGIKILEFIEKGGEMFKKYYSEYNELFQKNKKFYDGVRQNLIKFYVFFNYNFDQYANIPLPGLSKEFHIEILNQIRELPEFQWYFIMSNCIKSLFVLN
jgi:hypothetical protein